MTKSVLKFINGVFFESFYFYIIYANMYNINNPSSQLLSLII